MCRDPADRGQHTGGVYRTERGKEFREGERKAGNAGASVLM